MGLVKIKFNISIFETSQRLIFLASIPFILLGNFVNAQSMDNLQFKTTKKNNYLILENSIFIEIHNTIDNSVCSIYKIDSSFIEKIQERINNIAITLEIPEEVLDFSIKSLVMIMKRYKSIWMNHVTHLKIDFKDEVTGRSTLLGIDFHHNDLIECILSYCGEIIRKNYQSSQWNIDEISIEFGDVKIEYLEPYICLENGTKLRFLGVVMSELLVLDEITFPYWINQHLLNGNYMNKKNWKLQVERGSLNINNLLSPNFPIYYPPIDEN